jgi:ubiquinone/menaquinone biosynthesis C-methylase UbiE
MHDDVRSRFAPVAANYVTSSFHADAAALEEVVELCQPRPEDEALDVATGTGHTALALAPHVRRVVGFDLTPEMLDQARRLSAERGVENVDWILGDAEALPFPAASFDLYTARAAPHHFRRLAKALAEAHRVLRPGGRAVFVDCSPPPEARDLLHEVEVRRDPSHILSRTLDEWSSLLEEAGFTVEVLRRMEEAWEFEAWIRRMGVSPNVTEELAVIVEQAEGPARAALQPERREGKLFHRYWHAQIRARKRG